MTTAKHHRDLDRAYRPQHSPPMNFKEKIDAVKRGWTAPGYHNCRCSACMDFRGHTARQKIKQIMHQLNWK